MLLPAKMAETEILVHNSVKYDVLRAVQRSGFLHVEMHNIKNIETARASDEISKIVDYEFRVSKLMGILNMVRKRKSGIKSMLNPEEPEKFPTVLRKREEILRDAEETLRDIEGKMLKINEKWERVNDEEEKLKIQKVWVRNLVEMPFNLAHLGEGIYVNITAGSAKDISPLLKMKSMGKAMVWYRAIGKKKNVIYIVVIAYLLKDRKDVESALRFSGFVEYDLSEWGGNPKEVLRKIEKKEKKLKDEKESILNKIREMRDKYYAGLAILKDDLHNEKLKEEIHNKFGKTEYTTVIRGYIPKKKIEEAGRMIEKVSKGLSIFKWREAKGDNIPIVYNNPKILRPFQAFIDMYSTPKYGHIEPTVIIAPLFVIYFGLTLGDAGYGLIMAILGYLLWKRIGKYNWTNRTLGKILFPSGIMAIVFGLIQGGIFGPLNQYNFLTQFIKYKPIMDPMKDPVTLLDIALIVGIAQISLGLILGAYHHLKDKNYGDFLTSELSWFILLPSSGILIGYYFGWWKVSGDIILISWIFTIFSISLLLPGTISRILKKGNINGMFFFDITGMIGDWLSYSRLLALDLATSGIALTINIFTQIINNMVMGSGNLVCCLPLLLIGIALYAYFMRGKDNLKKGIALLLLIFGIVGMINLTAGIYLFLIFFLIIGHIGNAILQSLGSFVHSLRLQYVEFFSKFYEGDGIKFNPFREIRTHTKIGGVEK